MSIKAQERTRAGVGAAPYSIVDGLQWPAVPPAAGQAMLAMQYQLDQSQWLSGEAIRALQFRQLRLLIAHACAHVPHYRDHLVRSGIEHADQLTPEAFLRWPLLAKRAIQADSASFLSPSLPHSHGQIRWTTTSGSSGQPLRVAATDISVFFQHALVLRSHFWYELDHAGSFAAIRVQIEDMRFSDWGPPGNAIFRTGPSHAFNTFSDHDAQLDWLCRIQPTYLLTYNANLRALLERSRVTGNVPRGIVAVLGYGDMAAPDVARAAHEVWGAHYFDSYSCSETGTLALQCPSSTHLHVQSENVYVEILRDDGTPCAAGEIGRVVVTDLHNFAMPLIRYDLGDHASLGETCGCGRGLPVLNQIAGRSGHLACDPTGRRFFPHLNMAFWRSEAPILQRQIVQSGPGSLTVRYVAMRALSADEMARLTAALRKAMRYDYEVSFTRVDEIRKYESGKFLDFVSLTDQDPQAQS